MKIKKIKSKEVREEAVRLAQGWYEYSTAKKVKCLRIREAFKWGETPQGKGFWGDLSCGAIKNTKDLELPNCSHLTDPMRPDYYGGADNPYECRRVVREWELGPNLANVLKYVCRAGKKDPEKAIEDLQKAINYLKFEIEEL